MTELKQGFERLDYTEVKTYLNSGNVIFSSDETDTIKTASRIEEMIKNQFRLDIPVLVISKEELEDILCHAPEWWGDESKEIYDNLIFIIQVIIPEASRLRDYKLISNSPYGLNIFFICILLQLFSQTGDDTPRCIVWFPTFLFPFSVQHPKAFKASSVASRFARCQLSFLVIPSPVTPEPQPLMPTDSVPEWRRPLKSFCWAESAIRPSSVSSSMR